MHPFSCSLSPLAFDTYNLAWYEPRYETSTAEAEINFIDYLMV